MNVFDDELRACGFSPLARQFPRDRLALRLLAAFNNVRPDQLPAGAAYFPNAATRDAWMRVAAVVEEEAVRFRQTRENTVEPTQVVENMVGPPGLEPRTRPL